jgi:Sec-independent protein translocase protein TatA
MTGIGPIELLIVCIIALFLLAVPLVLIVIIFTQFRQLSERVAKLETRLNQNQDQTN